MANELVPIFSLSYTPSVGRSTTVAQFTEKAPGITVSDPTKPAISKSVAVATTDTSISLSEFATLGKMLIENTDGTHFVDLGPDSAGVIVPMVRLKPGEFVWVRLKPGITLRGQADTASVTINVLGFND